MINKQLNVEYLIPYIINSYKMPGNIIENASGVYPGGE